MVFRVQEIDNQTDPAGQQKNDDNQQLARRRNVFLYKIKNGINRSHDPDNIDNQSHNIYLFKINTAK